MLPKKTGKFWTKKKLLRLLIFCEFMFLLVFVPQIRKTDKPPQVKLQIASERKTIYPDLLVKPLPEKDIVNHIKIASGKNTTENQNLKPSPTPVRRMNARVKEKNKVVSVAVVNKTNTDIPKNTSTAVQKKPANGSVPETGFDDIFAKYGEEYGVNADLLKHIAICESGMNPDAVNGPYGGIFQFHPGTWASNRRAMGLTDSESLRFNIEESIRTAAFKINRDGVGAWPVCGRKAVKNIAVL